MEKLGYKLIKTIIKVTAVHFLLAVPTYAGDLCISLFLASVPPPLYIQAMIFSPSVERQSTSVVLDGAILEYSVNLASGKRWTNLSYEENLLDPRHDGFLPTASYMKVVETAHLYANGLSAFAKGAEARVSDAEAAAIRSSDTRLFNEYLKSRRLGFFAAYDPYSTNPDRTKGFMRVFDGTDYAAFGIYGVKNNSFLPVPTEASLKRQGVKTALFDDYRKKGYQIFQIGKYVLDKNLSPKERDRLRREMYIWLLDNYLDPNKMISDNVVFVINVDSLAHARTYEKNFGTTKISADSFDPKIIPPDALLVVELPVLRQKLLKLIAEIE